MAATRDHAPVNAFCKRPQRRGHIRNRTLIGTECQNRNREFTPFAKRPVLRSGEGGSAIVSQPCAQATFARKNAQILVKIRLTEGERICRFATQKPLQIATLFAPDEEFRQVCNYVKGKMPGAPGAVRGDGEGIG